MSQRRSAAKRWKQHFSAISGNRFQQQKSCSVLSSPASSCGAKPSTALQLTQLPAVCELRQAAWIMDQRNILGTFFNFFFIFLGWAVALDSVLFFRVRAEENQMVKSESERTKRDPRDGTNSGSWFTSGSHGAHFLLSLISDFSIHFSTFFCNFFSDNFLFGLYVPFPSSLWSSSSSLRSSSPPRRHAPLLLPTSPLIPRLTGSRLTVHIAQLPSRSISLNIQSENRWFPNKRNTSNPKYLRLCPNIKTKHSCSLSNMVRPKHV